MPTPTLHLSSPFDKLFESSPNYTKLRVYGFCFFNFLLKIIYFQTLDCFFFKFFYDLL
ncbi:unnamed protein product, partial [Vitis vinifera]